MSSQTAFDLHWGRRGRLGIVVGSLLAASSWFGFGQRRLWRDVHLDRRLIRVRQALPYDLATASNYSSRSGQVETSDPAAQDHRRRAEEAPAGPVSAGEEAGEFWENWVWPSPPTSAPLSPPDDYREFRRIDERAGLPRVRLRLSASSRTGVRGFG